MERYNSEHAFQEHINSNVFVDTYKLFSQEDLLAEDVGGIDRARCQNVGGFPDRKKEEGEEGRGGEGEEEEEKK